MNKNKTILTLGLLVVILPFLGFPGGFKTTLFIIFGLLISTLSFLAIQDRRLSQPREKTGHEVFEENISENFQDSEIIREDQNNLGN